MAKKARKKAKKKASKKKGKKKAGRRTTHRSRSGKKLYAVRSASGEFKDIQQYKRAHGQDIKRRAADEE